MPKRKSKRNNRSESGHLIERTIGSSNEISFNVLEQRTNTSQDDKAQDPWVMPASEVKAKKKSRRHNKAIVILALVMVVLLVSLIAIWMIAGFLEKQSGTAGNLDSQVRQTIEISDELSDFRKSLNMLFNETGAKIESEGIGDKYESQIEATNNLKNKLEQKKDNINSLLEKLATPFQRTLGNSALDLIVKEKDLISRGQATKDYVLNYLKERKLALEGYSLITKCQEADAEATELFLKGNSDDAKSAVDKANEAKEYAISARDKFSELAQINSGFDKYVSYCQVKIDAQEATASAASAYVARNKDEMDSQNDAYNELQQQAQELTKDWSEKPYETLDNEFYSNRSGDVEALNVDLKQRDVTYKKVSDELSKNE